MSLIRIPFLVCISVLSINDPRTDLARSSPLIVNPPSTIYVTLIPTFIFVHYFSFLLPFPIIFYQSLIRVFTNSFIHLFLYSHIHSFVYSYIHLFIHFIHVLQVPIAALPVPYRTTGEHKTFFSVVDPVTGMGISYVISHVFKENIVNVVIAL